MFPRRGRVARGAGWQNDDGIFAHGGDECLVADALDGPFVVLLHENGSDEANVGVFPNDEALIRLVGVNPLKQDGARAEKADT